MGSAAAQSFLDGVCMRESSGAKRKQSTHAYRVWLNACLPTGKTLKRLTFPVAPVWGRSEEERLLRVLPVACPRINLRSELCACATFNSESTDCRP